MSKEQVIKGTFILTLAGVVCRILGFLYKIFLSRSMSLELLGCYQLIFPVYGVCHTIFASSIQTGISNLSAGLKDTIHPLVALKTGLLFSFILSVCLSGIIFIFAELIATSLLMQPNLSTALRILCMSFPFAAIHSCINGYFYGIKKAMIPALSQLIEQCIRLLYIMLIPMFFINNFNLSVNTAVFALVLGEFAECIFSVISLIISSVSKKSINNNCLLYDKNLHKRIGLPLIRYCLPLMSSRLIVSLLVSLEAVLIPAILRVYGLSIEASLSIYGILTGMALPFILFPNALSSSYCLLMLSEVSSAKANNNYEKMKKSVEISFSFAAGLGIISSCIFLTYGRTLGVLVFNNESAGILISALSIISVFMYISSVMTSVLNGLGKTKTTFINSISAMILRIVLTVILVSSLGIGGYVVSMFLSDLVLCIINIMAIKKHIDFNIDIHKNILRPFLYSICVTMCFNYLYHYILSSNLHFDSNILNIIVLIGCIGVNGIFIILPILPLFKSTSS